MIASYFSDTINSCQTSCDNCLEPNSDTLVAKCCW